MQDPGRPSSLRIAASISSWSGDAVETYSRRTMTPELRRASARPATAPALSQHPRWSRGASAAPGSISRSALTVRGRSTGRTRRRCRPSERAQSGRGIRRERCWVRRVGRLGGAESMVLRTWSGQCGGRLKRPMRDGRDEPPRGAGPERNGSRRDDLQRAAAGRLRSLWP